MEFADITTWLAGGLAIAGLIQWIKGLAPKAPVVAWGILSPLMAIGWAYAPEQLRLAAGVLAISQLGWDLLIQPVRRKLRGS